MTKGCGGQAQVERFPEQSEEPSEDHESERGAVLSKPTDGRLRRCGWQLRPAWREDCRFRAVTELGTSTVLAGGPGD